MTGHQKAKCPLAGGHHATIGNSSATDFNAMDKPVASVVAALAMKGHVVHRGACADFTVSRWGMSRYCQDLDALLAFAKRVGAAS